MLSCFALCIGQTIGDAERLAALGARKTECFGNLKFAAPMLAFDEAALAGLLMAAGDRPRWLAVSTHAGEEALAARVHQSLVPDFAGLLTFVIPRHPDRGPAIGQEIAALGLTVARRSAGQPLTPATDVYLADSMGELGLFIRVAPLVLMGKSLVGQGGQNPLEPARLGASVLFGPHMGNFVDIAARMQQAEAATEVADEAALVAALRARLGDRTLIRSEGQRAQAFASAEDGVLPAVIGAIAAWLPRWDEDHAGA